MQSIPLLHRKPLSAAAYVERCEEAKRAKAHKRAELAFSCVMALVKCACGLAIAISIVGTVHAFMKLAA